jgi:hypothetical protein
MAVTSVQPLLSPPPIPANDGDGISRSDLLEGEWVVVDGMGAVRNGFAAGAILAGNAAPSPIIGAIPILQCLGGAIIVQTAIQETVPKSWQAWRKAMNCKDEADLTEGKISTGLGFANQLLYLAMGSELLASGVTGFLSSEAAHIFGYAPLIGSNAVNILSNYALGGTCIARGAVMLGRSLYNLNYIRKFEKGFLDCFNQKSNAERIDQAKEYLRKELRQGKERFTRRIGADVANLVEEALQNEPSDWKEILNQVDRSIFKQKLMQYLTFLIGIFMILGGIASVVFAGGALATTIGMSVSCCLFSGMESLWFTYDSSWLFNKITDKLYTSNKLWLEELQQDSNRVA